MSMKIRTEKVIDVSEWDALVKKTYGRQYSFQQQEGCKDRGVFRFSVPAESEIDDAYPDSVTEVVNGEEMGVNFVAWLARDPQQPLPGQTEDYQLRIWWDRNFYPDVQMVANDLHSKGLLEAGDYTIDIDW